MSAGRALSIVFRSGRAIAIDKPAGLPSTGRDLRDPDCAQSVLAAQLGFDVWAVHQLDRETSGVLVFVTRRSAVAEWQARIKPPARKIYLAIVHGAIEWERRDVRAPLAYDEAARRWVVRDDGRDAHSVMRRLARGDGASLVEVELRTGRTHQARVHLAHLGHPLLGEARYRAPRSDAHRRHALHAARLVLADGTRIEAPLPEDLRMLLKRHRLTFP